MSFFNVVPSILLRGVDPLDIISRYNNGGFVNTERIQSSEKSATKIAPITFAPISDSIEDAYYTFKDRNGHTQVIVFANHAEYKAYHEGKEIKRKCHFCFREFTHEPERIPISIEDRFLPSSTDPNRVKVRIVWGIKTFCHPNHCWSSIKQHLNMRYRYRDVIMQDTDIMYKNICKERFPNLVLKDIPLELWSEFGGSLDDEAFFSNIQTDGGTYTYNKMSSFIVVPAKVSYERRSTS